MKNTNLLNLRTLVILFLLAILSGCGAFRGSNETSRTTGWEYNSEETGNIPYQSGYEQQTGPGLVFIQGGTFSMGRVEEDVMYSWDNHPRRVTVASFYMDETEISNQDYREFVHWLARVYPGDREKINSALPDTTLWREELAYNEPYVNNYFRHPAYSDYPVVGVSWNQANDYASWRTDRVNEQILVERGILQHDVSQTGQNVFTTDAYLAGLYTGTGGEDAQQVRREDGILLPSYRLPTEAEWEYAAYGLIGNTEGELLTDRRLYPWDGAYLRQDERKEKGRLRANFVRGRGDMMGMAGSLNDNADITAPVFSYEPNDYGLYSMAGNVNEWTADVYRPLSFLDVNEFQPFRGNVITDYRRGPDGEFVRDEYGELVKDTIADYRNYRDGNLESQAVESGNWNAEEGRSTSDMYVSEDQPGTISSFINDEVRVYKGGSWKDRAYWLVPGTRRYLEQGRAQNDIGFRCVMDRTGSPQGF